MSPQEFAKLQALPPADAVAYLQRRDQLSVTYGWQDLWQEEHAQQFTVSRLTRADLLQALRDKIAASVQGDLSRRDFLRDAKGMLQQAGWWGTVEVTEPATGEILKTKFNPSRLQLIFDVNTRQAHAAGQWEGFERSKATHPFLRYITKRDERVRDAHRSWDNVTLPLGDAFWKTHYPPNGWRCRCRVVAVSQREYDQGYAEYRAPYEYNPDGTLKRIPDIKRIPFKKQAPETQWKQWLNHRTGQVEIVPVGIAPGFGYNPGLARATAQQAMVRDKLLALDAPTGAALWRSMPELVLTEQARNWQGLARRVSSMRQASGEALLVHVVDQGTLAALARQGVELSSAAVLMRDAELMHALRDTKVARGANLARDFWTDLPAQLSKAEAYLDTVDQALLYAIPLGAGQTAKVVVRLNYADKARLGRERQRVTANFVQTGGVVADYDLAAARYMPLKMNE